jgi:RNA polymerase sigma-70 factor (ECF subfamily)
MFVDGTQALGLIAIRGSVILGQVAQDREELGWIERAQAGDEAGYRWLLSRYRDRVVRVASATLGGAAEAEDVAQEAFIRAFRMLPSLERKSSFYGWVSKIAVRICLDKRRLKSAKDIPLSSVEYTTCYADCADSTSTAILVWQILNELPPQMRAALVLRELDGLEYEEIASLLRIPLGTVRSRLNAARAKFRSRWQEATRPVEVQVRVRY